MKAGLQPLEKKAKSIIVKHAWKLGDQMTEVHGLDSRTTPACEDWHIFCRQWMKAVLES